MLPPVLRSQIDQIVSEYLYEEKTLALIDGMLARIRRSLGTELGDSQQYLVGYVSSENNSLVVAITHKETDSNKYTTDLVSVGVPQWDTFPKNQTPDTDPDEETL